MEVKPQKSDMGEIETTNKNIYNTSMNQPTYTATQVAALDHYTTEVLGVDILQLMEAAGMRSAESALKLFGKGKDIAVLSGPGGNGGDALVCAKWLKLCGCNPTIYLSHPEEKLKPVTKRQLDIWRAFDDTSACGGLSTIDNRLSKAQRVESRLSNGVYDRPSGPVDGIIDGLLGYSLEGDPRGKSAELIEWANESGAPILALDIPSGLDATTGEVFTPCIKANHTVVFGVMKVGLTKDGASDYTGEIELVDIGFPKSIVEKS